jgi:hypothetical protein
MVFTVYGRWMANEINKGAHSLGLAEQDARAAVRDVEETGFGFRTAEGRPEEGFGDCIASPAWVCTQLAEKTPDLDLLLYMEHTWLDQDVIACTKRAAA